MNIETKYSVGDKVYFLKYSEDKNRICIYADLIVSCTIGCELDYGSDSPFESPPKIAVNYKFMEEDDVIPERLLYPTIEALVADLTDPENVLDL